jgi:hypothetical protein
MNKIGYVTTPYFGSRGTSHPLCESDEILYVRKHIEYLQQQTIQVDKIYLICTFSNDVNKSLILEKIEEICKGDSRFIICERENLGASYASWKHALHLDKGDCDYLILTEDDYCLYDEYAIEIMLKYFQDDKELFYLCQYWNPIPYQTEKYGVIEAHAAMASGLLDNKKYYDLFLEKGFDFRICYDTTYISFCDNQAMFLEDYRSANLKIIDWRDTYSSYFPNSKIEYGNPDGLKLMIPLQDDLGYF